MLAHKGVLLVAAGLRYKGYCANVGRTFVVDPTKVPILEMPLFCTLNLTEPIKTGARSSLRFTCVSPVRTTD